MRSLLIVLVAIAAALAEETVRYDGYKTYRVVPGCPARASILKSLEHNENVDFWTEIRAVDKPVDIMVNPTFQSEFERLLKSNDIEYSIWINDVQKNLAVGKLMERLSLKSKSARIDLNKFHTHEEMNAYLEELGAAYPDIVTVEYLGKSYEGRDMKAITISTGGGGKKPGIYVDGGIHAREWAASAETLCLISQLVEDERNRNMLDNVDWFILPSVNPDGFTYSRTKDQMWRKTRSPGKKCYGADPNRNFDFHWMESGADQNECSVIYAGKHAFSEIESVNVANYTMKHRDQLKLYLTFHSYGQYILYPWGYDGVFPDNVDELDSVGRRAAEAIKSVYGSAYTVGSSATALYPAAGGSDDWVKAVAGVPLAYTVELPAGGSTGFDLPPSKLQQVCTETFEGIKAFHEHIETNYS